MTSSIPLTDGEGLDHQAEPDGRLTILSYVLADKAHLYKSVMRVFMEARARYQLHRRPSEVIASLRAAGYEVSVEEEAHIEETLEQLVQWGNLTKTQQTSGARTLEEWRQRRFLYQITTDGERAEHHLCQLMDALSDQGSLQRVMLRAVLENLRAVASEAETPAPDPDKLYRLLIDLRSQFNSLTENASAFLISVSRALDATAVDSSAFQAYKLPLLAYIETFIEELTRLSPPIVRVIRQIQGREPGRMFQLAASANDVPQLDGTRRDESVAFGIQWQGLCGWFIGAPSQPANSDALRDEARAAVNRMLSILTRLAEARSGRLSRRTDLVALAKRFDALRDDEEAHQLFKATFGLFSARHLDVVNQEEELDLERLERPKESWWESAPVAVPIRLRETGPYSRLGRAAAVDDLSLNKQRLAKKSEKERLERQTALTALVGQGPVRVSSLGWLDLEQFDALVELLAFTLAKPRSDGDVTIGQSRDGALEILLAWPANDAWTCIETSIGRLQMPDYRIEILDRNRASMKRKLA